MPWKEWPKLMAAKVKGQTIMPEKPTEAAMRAARAMFGDTNENTRGLTTEHAAAIIDRETNLPAKEAALRAAADLTDKWKRTEHGADFHHVDNLLRAALKGT